MAAWDTCTAGSLPVYTWAVDWAQNGQSAAGKILNTNPYVQYGSTGWSGFQVAITWVNDMSTGTAVPLPAIRAVPDGVSSFNGVEGTNPRTPLTAGNSYVVDGWIYSPRGWSQTMQVGVDFYTSGGSYISTVTSPTGSIAAGVWTHYTFTVTAPATTASGAVRTSQAGTTPKPAVTDVYYVFGLLLMDPTLPEESVTPSPLSIVKPLGSGATWGYGRDQLRQISPAAIGQAAFSVDNSTRAYSPENISSPLSGTLDAARPMAASVSFLGTSYPLFSGRINDYTVNVARGDRSVDFTFLDLEASIQNSPVTTQLYSGMRTGDAVNAVLDAVGWTGPRSIDPGATLMPWWWLTNVIASTAIDDLVKSEGPPAIAYCAPDGTFVFRDRTHRLLYSRSLNVQGSYAAALVNCSTPAATGLHFTDPLVYAHGWRDILNTVNFSVDQRAPAADLSAVWTSTGTLVITTGETLTINVSSSDPFLMAVPPVQDTDYTVTGGTLNVTIGQTSGSSTTLMLQAVGGDCVVTGLQLRAVPVTVVQTTIVQRSDTASIGQHGSQAYPDQAPWAGTEDAYAIAGEVLLRYAQRRPTVEIRVVASDPAHYLQILQRTVSDLVYIRHDELGLASDFYVEHVAHTAQRMNLPGQPPVHAVVLGCEEQVYQSTNPFTFDLTGAGFDQGIFDPPAADNPANVFVFDDPVRGVFDFGVLGT